MASTKTDSRQEKWRGLTQASWPTGSFAENITSTILSDHCAWLLEASGVPVTGVDAGGAAFCLRDAPSAARNNPQCTSRSTRADAAFSRSRAMEPSSGGPVIPRLSAFKVQHDMDYCYFPSNVDHLERKMRVQRM